MDILWVVILINICIHLIIWIYSTSIWPPPDLDLIDNSSVDKDDTSAVDKDNKS